MTLALWHPLMKGGGGGGGGVVEQDSRSTKQGEQKHLREGQIPSPAPQIMVWLTPVSQMEVG